jgi:pimeloyl-ACP methyl ester carboxylesterase
LDHTSPTDKRSFKLRYWYNNDHFDAKDLKAPMFLYICGEYTCQPPEGFGRAFPHQLAKEHKGLMLVLEHRYYGKSQPFEDWSVPNLRYLNIENALADIAAFLTSMNEDLVMRYGGERRKTFVIGGSYPGAVSAWVRYKYPHIIDGALSSSGVVNAVEDLF